MTDVADLEKRIKALEVGATFEATQTEVQKVESDFLTKFQDIREALVTKGGAGGSGGGASSKEMEALKAENESLKRRNGKLEYRVRHMSSTMEELYGKQKTTSVDV